jgi:hypothetical protein
MPTPKPTIRLHFTDGTHYDCFANTWFYLIKVGPVSSYRKAPCHKSTQFIYRGDTIRVPDGEDSRVVELARREILR